MDAAYASTDRGKLARRRAFVKHSTSEHGKIRHREVNNEWSKNNPQGRSAQTELNDAVKAGRLERMPCEVCGDTKSHGHHPDYSKPLEVIWLCAKHHAEEHKRLRDAA
jgi:hypothetical protein